MEKPQGPGGLGSRPAWLSSSVFPMESRYLDLGEALVHYVDEGSGAPLLFIHPAPSSSFMYRRFIAALKEDFRCVALDYPGFGLSVARDGFAFTFDQLSGTVARFVEALNLRDITMVVHDTGGPIGLGAAVRAPDRYRAFVITAAPGFAMAGYWPVQAMLRLVTSRPFRALNGRYNILARLVSSVAPIGRRLSPEERAVYRHLFSTREQRDRVLLLFRQLIDNPAYLARLEADLRAHFRNAPALLMFGQFDPTRLVGWMDRFRKIFPRHTATIVPREGHFPHEGSPQRMIDEIKGWDAALRRVQAELVAS